MDSEIAAHRMQVVIVDDVELNAGLIRAFIQRLPGTEAHVFTDPREALRWCTANEPDLVLIDYMMPDLDGLAFISLLRRQKHLADIPVIVVTANDSRQTLYTALEVGANDFLRKPVDDVELMARVRNMLKLRSRQLQLAAANSRLYVLATTDALTGVASRRHFLELLATDVAQARRYGTPLALALIDADNFKQINDRRGHPTGDRVLQTLARLLREGLRTVDRVGRLGGEEFAIALPHTTPDSALQVCERLRRAIDAAVLTDDAGPLRFTVSVGLTQFAAEDRVPDDLIRRADAALYRAKQDGRNRTRVAQEDAGSGPGLVDLPRRRPRVRSGPQAGGQSAKSA